MTVQISGATDLNDHELTAFLYAADEHSIYTAGKVLACNAGTVASGTATMVLKVDNGSFEPTTTDWVGTDGTSYDLYIGTDANVDGDNQPATTVSIDGGEAFRPANYPLTVTMNGPQTVALTYGDLVEYTGGTLTVTVENATEDRDMFFGVFMAGADPEIDDAVGYGTAVVSPDGTAEDTADQEMGGSWYGTDGTSYDLYVFIDEDGSGSDGPNSGDLTYEEKPYTQSGNKSVTLDAGADFTVFP